MIICVETKQYYSFLAVTIVTCFWEQLLLLT